MKKKIGVVCCVVFLLLSAACYSDYPRKSDFPQLGAYEFQTAVVTDLLTGETQEKTAEELLLGDSSNEWVFLLNFFVGIREDTEVLDTRDGRRVVLNKGFAFEIIAENTLKTRLPYWRVYGGIYDVVILLNPAPRYC